MKQILFIDNSKPIRLLLHNLFKKDYAVITMPDCASALRHLAQVGIPDLIIIDPSDSKSSEDYMFIQYIKTSVVFRRIRIVVLTKDIANIESLLPESSISLYVEKPFDPIKFRGSISTLLAS
jgi:CheY-like chemotaxis protein